MNFHFITELNLKKNYINQHILDNIEYQAGQNLIMSQNKDEDPELLYIENAANRQQKKKSYLITDIK